MRKRGIVGAIGLIVFILILGACWFIEGCWTDYVGVGVEECVPASCCHADSCVLESEAVNCSGMVCSMECRPGTMDCGAGHCEFDDGNCEVVLDE